QIFMPDGKATTPVLPPEVQGRIDGPTPSVASLPEVQGPRRIPTVSNHVSLDVRVEGLMKVDHGVNDPPAVAKDVKEQRPGKHVRKDVRHQGVEGGLFDPSLTPAP